MNEQILLYVDSELIQQGSVSFVSVHPSRGGMECEELSAGCTHLAVDEEVPELPPSSIPEFIKPLPSTPDSDPSVLERCENLRGGFFQQKFALLTLPAEAPAARATF